MSAPSTAVVRATPRVPLFSQRKASVSQTAKGTTGGLGSLVVRAVDKALSFVGLERSPKFAARSMRASVYGGARNNGLTADWFASVLSADQELKGDLRRLR